MVWDTEANTALNKWGQNEVNKIAREWAKKRREDNQRELQENELYVNFQKQAEEIGNTRALKLADQLVRQAIDKNPTASVEELSPIIQMSLDFFGV